MGVDRMHLLFWFAVFRNMVPFKKMTPVSFLSLGGKAGTSPLPHNHNTQLSFLRSLASQLNLRLWLRFRGNAG